MDVVARSAALDHVAGQRVRRAAEADDAEAIAEVRGDFLDGAGDVGQVVGAVGAQGAHIVRGAHGVMDDRPFAGLELEGQAHGLERQQQVGKDDGRVDAELFSGGDGNFGGESGLLANLDQRVVLADVAILLHVAAGLAQKPDRRAIDGPAQTGADEAVTGEKRVLDRGLRLDWHSLSILLGDSPLRLPLRASCPGVRCFVAPPIPAHSAAAVSHVSKTGRHGAPRNLCSTSIPRPEPLAGSEFLAMRGEELRTTVIDSSANNEGRGTRVV